MFPILFILFVAAPIAEIYVLIKVGSIIGALPTVAVVVGTAILGAALLRIQGTGTMRRLQAELAAGELPAVTLVEGGCLLIAGALLLTPGFITDSLGFACLIPPLRRRLAQTIVSRLSIRFTQGLHRPGVGRPDAGRPGVQGYGHGGASGSHHQSGGRIIEGEVEPGDKS